MNKNKKYLQNIVFTGFLLFVYFLNSSAQFSFSSGTANTTNSGTENVRLLNEVNSIAALSIYGGNLKSGTDATGFFYIKKVNGCWYIVDPEGYLFLYNWS